MEAITKVLTELRVLSCVMKPFSYGVPDPNEPWTVEVGEVNVVKAIGTWGECKWPVSLHITVPPGCGVIPHLGNGIKITVERA